jgi:hypothetical protein
MTQTEHTAASQPASLPVPTDRSLDERSRRAREEPMAVHAFGTNVYEVETDHDASYLVDVAAARCTCPDHVFRDARCKHLRRVAIEITAGRVPPPGQLAFACPECGTESFAPSDTDVAVYCEAHRLRPGDVVNDRETGADVVVVATSDRHADAVEIRGQDTTVAGYETNSNYSDDDPVVAAVYPESVTVSSDGATPASLKVYLFPRSRLEQVG